MKRPMVVMLVLGLSLSVQVAQADWSPAKRLTWNSGWSENPAIAIDSDNTIHVVWDDTAPGGFEIYYKRSADSGTTWSPIKRLTWTSEESCCPAIASDSSNAIHVVWYDRTPGQAEIYYKRSTDGGTSWGAAKRLTWTSGESLIPAISIGLSNTLHVVWYDDTPGNTEIYYRRSVDGGATWSEAKRLTWNLGASYQPALAIDSGDAIHVAWSAPEPGNMEIYYKRSTDGSTSWSVAKRLTWTSGGSYFVAMTIDPADNIHVAWNDTTPGNLEIYYKRSADGGNTWSAAKRLTWTSAASSEPAIATVSGNTIHVVWQDDTPGNAEIYDKRSTDGGTTWTPAKRLTRTSDSSYSPAMAIDSDNTIHIVWEDETPGRPEIYYIKGN